MTRQLYPEMGLAGGGWAEDDDEIVSGHAGTIKKKETEFKLRLPLLVIYSAITPLVRR